MVTAVDKIERIDRSEEEIKEELGSFFKKYNLVLKKKSEKGFVWGNDDYNLIFLYGPERYFWFIFQGLFIEYKDKTYNFHDIIDFMQWNQNFEYLDFYEVFMGFGNYEKYMEERLIPFLNMYNNIEKMDAYLKKSYPWYK